MWDIWFDLIKNLKDLFMISYITGFFWLLCLNRFLELKRNTKSYEAVLKMFEIKSTINNLHRKPLFVYKLNLTQRWINKDILIRILNTKFHENKLSRIGSTRIHKFRQYTVTIRNIIAKIWNVEYKCLNSYFFFKSRILKIWSQWVSNYLIRFSADHFGTNNFEQLPFSAIYFVKVSKVNKINLNISRIFYCYFYHYYAVNISISLIWKKC